MLRRILAASSFCTKKRKLFSTLGTKKERFFFVLDIKKQRSFSTLLVSSSVSFLQYLKQLVDDLKISRPLSRALSQAGEQHQRMEVLAYEVIRRPEFWLKNVDDNSIEGLVNECLPTLPPDLYLPVLSKAIHFQRQRVSGHVKEIAKDLILRKNWELTLAVLGEFQKFGLAVPVRHLNNLLHHASKASDPQHFVSVYSFFRLLRIEPNAMTYGIVILWNSTRPFHTREEINPETTNLKEKINSILYTAACHTGETISSGTASIKGEKSSEMKVESNLATRSLSESGQVTTFISTDKLCDLLDNLDSKSGSESIKYFVNALLSRDDVNSEICLRFWRIAESIEGFDSSIVFSRILPVWLRNMLLDAFVVESKHAELVRGHVLNNEYAQAHLKLLEADSRKFLERGNYRVACQLIQAAILNALHPIDTDIIVSVVTNSIRSESISDGINLMALMARNEVLCTNGIPWNTLIHSIYEKGRASESFLLLAALNGSGIIPETVKIYANMLLTDDKRDLLKFIDEELLDMAKKNSNTLSIALESLVRRHRFQKAPQLLRKIAKENPTIVTPLHYAIAIRAAVLGNDRDNLGYLRNALSEQSIMYLSLKRSVVKNKPLIVRSSVENQALGLAVVLVYFFDTNVRRFENAFFKLFTNTLNPNHDSVRVFLSILSDYGQGELDAEWGPLFMAWMERRGLVPNTSTFVKLLRLATKRNDPRLLEFTLNSINSHNIRLTSSVCKELLEYLFCSNANISGIEKVLETFKRDGIRLNLSQLEKIILMAVKDCNLERALEWTKASIEEGRKISRKAVADLLDSLYKSWPLASFLPLLDYFHSFGYFASKGLYEDFLREAIRKGDLRMVRYYYNMILRSDGNPQVADALKILELSIASGRIQNALQVFEDLKWNKMLPSGLETVSKLLDRYMKPCVEKDAGFLLEILPMKELQTRGINEVLHFALKEKSILSSKWCQSALDNCLAVGDFSLAGRVHLYLVTNSLEYDGRLSSHVFKMWSMQLCSLANSKLNKKT